MAGNPYVVDLPLDPGHSLRLKLHDVDLPFLDGMVGEREVTLGDDDHACGGNCADLRWIETDALCRAIAPAN